MTRVINDEDTVKIAKVFIVENFLVGKRNVRLVDEFVMKLVDNEERFEKYPSGRHSYDEKVLYYRGALKNLSNTKKNYELCGFLLALQIWAYEVFPKIGWSRFAKHDNEKILRTLK
ncbi:hypothetical protein TorRG33x02_307240 [Trema orientale]|uniref:DUF1985 domain-containing protein n=1 Tax=Trema orientale TaxID=63057 RepID=A0A2P5BVS2_TREOI|nr:hypothetical protein TorRG33x02_307240 [Trema orientale]